MLFPEGVAGAPTPRGGGTVMKLSYFLHDASHQLHSCGLVSVSLDGHRHVLRPIALFRTTHPIPICSRLSILAIACRNHSRDMSYGPHPGVSDTKLVRIYVPATLSVDQAITTPTGVGLALQKRKHWSHAPLGKGSLLSGLFVPLVVKPIDHWIQAPLILTHV